MKGKHTHKNGEATEADEKKKKRPTPPKPVERQTELANNQTQQPQGKTNTAGNKSSKPTNEKEIPLPAHGSQPAFAERSQAAYAKFTESYQRTGDRNDPETRQFESEYVATLGAGEAMAYQQAKEQQAVQAGFVNADKKAITEHSNQTSLQAAPPQQDFREYPIRLEKGQKTIKTQEELDRYAESVIGVPKPLKWSKLSDAELRSVLDNGVTVRYKLPIRTDEVRKEVEALPEEKKNFIQDADSRFAYTQNLRILDLLKQLSPEDMADYKSKVSMATTSPATIEASLADYINDRDLRNKEKTSREDLQAQLTVKDFRELYKEYREYKSLLKYNKPTPSGNRFTSSKIEKDRIDGINRRNATARDQFSKSLTESGFTGGISGFEALVDSYELAFRTETVHIAEDALKKYGHTLFQEGKQLLNEAFLDNLLARIKASGAKENYKEADAASTGASGMAFAEKPTASERQFASEMRGTAAAKKAQGNAAIGSLASITALVNDNGFDKEGFAKIQTKAALRSFLENYISSQQGNISKTIANLKAGKGINIYNYDSLLEKSKERQGIAKGSIFDLIVTDKQNDEHDQKIINSLVIGMLAVALGLLTFGTGTVAVLMAAGNFALGAYLTGEEIDHYRTQLAAYKVDISKDEPSAVWVVISVVGSVLDAAAVAKISKQLVTAGRVFEESKDVTKTTKALKEAGLDPVTENKVLKALEQESGSTKNATEEEVLEATKRIKDYRAVNKLKGGNYGYLEGIVNGKNIDNKLWRSVPLDVAENEIHIFTAIKVSGKGGEWLRITDSEYRMLNKLAKDLGAKKGGKYPEIVGQIKIISENPYCASCTGIIDQFKTMFPNIKITLVNGAK